ncbi:YciI family protein [Actinoplanes sp. NPDC051411]|uniref:YciI family protein n=1 Tax=Actinoplanes sp. NPDC051411 TaxID=3155522 RepID=UPI00341997B2
MWIIELSLAPTPGRLAARPAHRRRLTDLHNDRVVRMAGPLDGETGAIIIVDVPDRPAVDAIITDDPYFTTDGVTVVDVREWHPFLD